MSARSAVPWIGTICGIAALAATWLTLWPIGLGGSTAYAVIVGTSMEPHLHRGDVAVLRENSEYHVGDVVAYHSRLLGSTVLHRIIGAHDGLYAFKGDANDFTDPGNVRRSDLIGRYWFKIAGAAPVLQWVQRPWHAGLFAGLLGILLFGGGAGVTVRRRRVRHRRARPESAPRRSHSATPVNWIISNAWQPTAVAASVALVAFVTLGVVSHQLPATRNVPTDRLYTQSGRFSYGAPVPVSAAYPSGRVASGDAVFTRLVQRLDVGFDWRFSSDRAHVIHGTASLAAEVSDGGGWTRRIALVPSEPFAGDRLTLDGTLQLDALQAMLRRLEADTGTRSSSYHVSIVPTARVAGVVNGAPMKDVFAPPLQLSLDQSRLQLAGSSDPAQSSSLTRSKNTSGMLTEPNRIVIAGRQLSLGSAMRTAVIGGAGSLALLLVALIMRLTRRAPADEAARVRARYGRWIVRVADASPASRVVDLTDFDDLARIAERYDRVILQDEQTDEYVVEEEGVSYRWRPVAPATAEALAHIVAVVEHKGARARPAERRNLKTRPWSVVRLESRASKRWGR
jgi:signal peptidase I